MKKIKKSEQDLIPLHEQDMRYTRSSSSGQLYLAPGIEAAALLYLDPRDQIIQ